MHSCSASGATSRIKSREIDGKVRKSTGTGVAIPMSKPGKGAIVRMNAVPVLSLPGECHAITFRSSKEWTDLRAARAATEGKLIFTKSDTVLCWGPEALIRAQFSDIEVIASHDISTKIANIGHNLYIKGFLEEALSHALARGKPLLTRTTRSGSYLIADAHSRDQAALEGLNKAVGKTAGQITGLFTPIDDDYPYAEKVFWAEAVRMSIDIADGRSWLILDPDVWIWPPRARKNATKFLDDRRGGRYNKLLQYTAGCVARGSAWYRPQCRGQNLYLCGGYCCREPIFHHRHPNSVFAQGRMSGNRSELPGFTSIPEPDLMFAAGGLDKHPLRGLIEYGPYSARYGTPVAVQFALVGPRANMGQLRKLALELVGNAKTREVPAYYPDYPGFERVFRIPIAPVDEQLIFPFPDQLDDHVLNRDKRALACGLFQRIAQLLPVRANFDVALVYLPPTWAACFEDESFDFHDYLKAFCAPANIPVQILRQTSFDRTMPIKRDVGF